MGAFPIYIFCINLIKAGDSEKETNMVRSLEITFLLLKKLQIFELEKEKKRILKCLWVCPIEEDKHGTLHLWKKN